MADSEAVNRIFEKYEEKRVKAAIERNERIEEIYLKFPRIKEIEDEINLLGIRNVKNILKDPDNHQKYNTDFDLKVKKLENEKNSILDKNGIDPNFKKYRYECEECSDTGYTPDGKKCRCFMQSMADEAYNISNISELMRKNNFDTFSFDYYSKEKGKYPDSPFNNIKRIYNRTKNFCENFDEFEKGLFFYGSTGLGKTFLSCAAAKNLIDKGKIVIFMRASKLFSLLEDYKFGRLSDKKIIDNIYSCDLLIIDDLGAEVKNKLNTSMIFDILDERIISKKKMIINTNLDMNELSKEYSMRFTSRIVENFVICNFYGDDIRYKMI